MIKYGIKNLRANESEARMRILSSAKEFDSASGFIDMNLCHVTTKDKITDVVH